MRAPAASRRGPRHVAALAPLLLLAAASCAKKGPPSGGPPDITPPRVISAVPDSGTARVPLDARLSLTFSEGMEPRSTGDAVALAPRVDIRQRRWNARTLSLVLEQPLRPRQTYTLVVGASARDRHGNPLAAGRTLVFSTADSFPAGLVEGTIDARGFAAQGTMLWCYAWPKAPDSTARDFDAIGLADTDGHFRIPGLPVPGRYRLWAFADLNGNRSFEPDKDVLAPADTVLDLSAGVARVSGLLLRVVNPRAPGHVRGVVVDSTGDSLGVMRVAAISQADSSRRVVVDPDVKGAFDLELAAGAWTVRAFRDHDRNRAWRVDLEPASPVEVVQIEPAATLTDVVLRLHRVPGGP